MSWLAPVAPGIDPLDPHPHHRLVLAALLDDTLTVFSYDSYWVVDEGLQPAALMAALRNNRSMTSATFRRWDEEEDADPIDYTELVAAVAGHPTLTALTLHAPRIVGANGWATVARVIQSLSPRLKSLRVDDQSVRCQPHSDAASHLLRVLTPALLCVV
jgi:hypothetical protein